MSRIVVLTSCVKTKQTDGEAHAAADLYTSPLFTGMRQYAEREGHAWFILSAAHGVIDPAQELEAYDTTLTTMKKEQRQAWSAMVMAQLAAILEVGDRVIVLAGMAYREFLMAPLAAAGWTVDVPMAGLMLGQQKAWLNAANAAPSTDTPAPEVGLVGSFCPTKPPPFVEPTPLFDETHPPIDDTPAFTRYQVGQIELPMVPPKPDARMAVVLGFGWIGHRDAIWGRIWTWTHPHWPGRTIRHCGHPTAHRPYFIEGDATGRTFYRLRDAQATILQSHTARSTGH